jgi:hypothetical protein
VTECSPVLITNRIWTIEHLTELNNNDRTPIIFKYFNFIFYTFLFAIYDFLSKSKCNYKKQRCAEVFINEFKKDKRIIIVSLRDEENNLNRL